METTVHPYLEEVRRQQIVNEKKERRLRETESLLRRERRKIDYSGAEDFTGRCEAFIKANPEFLPMVIEVTREVVAAGHTEIPTKLVLGVAMYRLVFHKGHAHFVELNNNFGQVFFHKFVVAAAPDLRGVFGKKRRFKNRRKISA